MIHDSALNIFLHIRSNCVPRVQKILRKHYHRPTFLPQDSESSSLDWIFMGGSGTGALMHVSINVVLIIAIVVVVVAVIANVDFVAIVFAAILFAAVGP